MKASKKRPATLYQTAAATRRPKIAQLANANTTTEIRATGSQAPPCAPGCRPWPRTLTQDTLAQGAGATQEQPLGQKAGADKQSHQRRQGRQAQSTDFVGQPRDRCPQLCRNAGQSGDQGTAMLRNRSSCWHQSARSRMPIRQEWATARTGWCLHELGLQPIADHRIAQKLDEGFHRCRRFGCRRRRLGQARMDACDQEDADGKPDQAEPQAEARSHGMLSEPRSRDHRVVSIVGLTGR